MARPGEETIGDALRAAVRELGAAGVATAELDAEVLLAHALGLSRARLLAERRAALGGEGRVRFAALVERRRRREPVAYLVGEREFWSLPLAVDARVLVPRPETETVVEEVLRILRRPTAQPSGGAARRRRRVADVGTGSGAIALALASEAGPGIEIVAVDRSRDALAVARENARRLAGRLRVAVELVRGDLLASFAGGSLDLVVANPPYVSEAELAAADPELAWEPRGALAGGDPDGLGVVRLLLAQACRVLVPGGAVVVEIGAAQGGAAAQAARGLRLHGIRVVRDLAGRDRVLVARREADTLQGSSADGAA